MLVKSYETCLDYVIFSSTLSICLNLNISHCRSDFKQDGSRRRQTSGNRPLSAINDECDPLNLLAALGYKLHDGQVCIIMKESFYKCFFFHKL